MQNNGEFEALARALHTIRAELRVIYNVVSLQTELLIKLLHKFFFGRLIPTLDGIWGPTGEPLRRVAVLPLSLLLCPSFLRNLLRCRWAFLSLPSHSRFYSLIRRFTRSFPLFSMQANSVSEASTRLISESPMSRGRQALWRRNMKIEPINGAGQANA